MNKELTENNYGISKVTFRNERFHFTDILAWNVSYDGSAQSWTIGKIYRDDFDKANVRCRLSLENHAMPLSVEHVQTILDKMREVEQNTMLTNSESVV